MTSWANLVLIIFRDDAITVLYSDAFCVGSESGSAGIAAAVAEHSEDTFTVGCYLWFISLSLSVSHMTFFIAERRKSVSNCWTGSRGDSIATDL